MMTPDSAMVLTGKQALDFAGGVSAEDNFGIGGYDRIMGPNGQAQYWAPDLAGACRMLLAHYEHTYVAPGERFPRRARDDRPDRPRRPRRAAPAAGLAAARRVGDVFSDEANPDRKLPFDIRSVMRAVADADHAPLERWAGDARRRGRGRLARPPGRLAGGLLGIESHPLPAPASLPADGPEQWTSGTLFPRSAKKIARAINAASGRRAARRAGQPRRLRRLARVDARAAAGVRRRDRPRGRQLPRPDRLLRRSPATTAAPSSSSRRSSTTSSRPSPSRARARR